MTRLLAAFVLQHAVAAAAAKSSDLTCALDSMFSKAWKQEVCAWFFALVVCTLR